MGGKGQRRREKNFRAAHGGSARLPPPPDPSSLDVLPAKLRKIMSLAGAEKKPSNATKIQAGGGVEKRILSREECDSTSRGTKRVRNDPNTSARQMDHGDQMLQHSSREKKKKRKRRGVKDLRFEGSEGLSHTVSKRKERKKERLEARKKKQKARSEEAEDFKGHEEIKFGEVVKAPPKLIAVPKVLKTTQDASQERLRLQAVDAYRKRKGWTSRLGVQLPSLVPT
ncbi:hypothetical protein F511_15377 [Dorcoceras hygrometricum]|uniref:Uncharacterized protein n=1 Tax=Dorcoceras hygrometricum TaxID=472368 RepID=A0A2Z7CBA8_9LAMI|nr:hypothetical protein F511_15377 [Dorcoceras hygrometricum]